MASFLPAIGVVLRHEGGLSEDPRDPGGVTNFGISLAWAKDHLGADWDADRIIALRREQAIELYRIHFWTEQHLEEVADQWVSTKILDMTINCGLTGGGRLVQQAVHDCGAYLVLDGRIGPATCAAANRCDQLELLTHLFAQSVAHYRSSPLYPSYKRSWLRRARWPWPDLPIAERKVS